MKRLKPLFKKLALGLSVVLIAFTFLILEENIRGRVALHAYMRALRTQGEKLSLPEFESLEPSEGGTAAAKELTAAGKELEALRKSWPDISARVNIWIIRQGQSVVLHQQPDLGVPRRRPATWDDLNEQLSRASSALARVRATLRNHDLAARGGLSHIKDTNYWAYLDARRNAADWLGGAALADLHRGDLDAAVDNIGWIANLAQLRKPEPLLNSELARRQAARTGLHVTWEALHAAGVTQAQLVRLQSVWEDSDFTDGAIESLECERVWRLGRFEDVRMSPHAFWEVCRGEMSCCHECGGTCDLKDLWFDTQGVSRALLWRLAWLDQDELEFLQEWQVCLDQARDAIAHGDRTRFRSNEIARVPRRSWYDTRRYLMSQQLAPMDEMMVLQPMYVETERRMAVAAIALKRFDLAHGAWPDALMELTPTFLRDVPRDLMDGQPLRYRRNEDGTFTLYSVGQNCVDDGGSVERDRDHLPNGMMWMTCDAVWPMPASSAEIDAAQSKR